jgi:hypothetical protein
VGTTGTGVGEEGLRKMFGTGKNLKMEEIPEMYRNIKKR